MHNDRTREPLSRPSPHSRVFLDDNDDDELREGRGLSFWVGVLLVTICIAGLCWYGYPLVLKQKSRLLDELPALQTSFAALTQRVSKSEAELLQWHDQQAELRSHLDELQSGIEAKLRAAQQREQEIAERVYRRASAVIDSRTGQMEMRLARVESANRADQAKLESLEGELSKVRQDTARQASQLAAAEEAGKSESDALRQQVAGVDQRAGTDRRELRRIAQSVDNTRVDFELTRNHNQHLASGISICVTGTKLAERRVNGWMWIMPDRKTIWLRDQGVQQPVVFYSQADGKRREVVFTAIGKNSVAGYALLPADGESAGASAGSTRDSGS